MVYSMVTMLVHFEKKNNASSCLLVGSTVVASRACSIQFCRPVQLICLLVRSIWTRCWTLLYILCCSSAISHALASEGSTATPTGTYSSIFERTVLHCMLYIATTTRETLNKSDCMSSCTPHSRATKTRCKPNFGGRTNLWKRSTRATRLFRVRKKPVSNASNKKNCHYVTDETAMCAWQHVYSRVQVSNMAICEGRWATLALVGGWSIPWNTAPPSRASPRDPAGPLPPVVGNLAGVGWEWVPCLVVSS
jgi:hypothetical protein